MRSFISLLTGAQGKKQRRRQASNATQRRRLSAPHAGRARGFGTVERAAAQRGARSGRTLGVFVLCVAFRQCSDDAATI